MHDIKIPKERVGVLVGKNGEVKRLIEKKTETKLIIDKEGDIVINGEGVNVYNANIIIKSIGRGFNPSIALNLLKDDINMEIINIKDFSGKSRKKLERIRARIIGTGGKCRQAIERITNTDIVVYGKTVSIIGKIDNTNVARAGVEILLRGAPHSNAYKYLEREIGKLNSV